MENLKKEQKGKNATSDKMLHKIIDNTLNTLSVSSLHGVGNVIRNEHKFIKVMWVLFILGSAAFCTFNILNNFATFFE